MNFAEDRIELGDGAGQKPIGGHIDGHHTAVLERRPLHDDVIETVPDDSGGKSERGLAPS